MLCGGADGVPLNDDHRLRPLTRMPSAAHQVPRCASQRSASTGTWPRCAQPYGMAVDAYAYGVVVHRLLEHAAVAGVAGGRLRQGRRSAPSPASPRPRRSSARSSRRSGRGGPPPADVAAAAPCRPRRRPTSRRSSPSSSRHLRRRHPRYVDLKLRVLPREAGNTVFFDTALAQLFASRIHNPHKTRHKPTPHGPRLRVCGR